MDLFGPEIFGSEMLNLWLTDDSAIQGSTTHPVLTHKLPTFGFGELYSEVVGYIPQADQGSIYSNACAVLQSFHFVGSFSHTNFDDSGIDISVDVEVNGQGMLVQYNKIQAKDGLPPDVASLLALLRRNLPASYSGLFDYLHVVRLPALSADQANRYRQCQLHHEWMKVGDVPIVYGLLRSQKAYWKAQKKFFPNADLYWPGGCSITDESPKSKKVLYCEACRKAEAEWQKKHSKKTKQATSK